MGAAHQTGRQLQQERWLELLPDGPPAAAAAPPAALPAVGSSSSHAPHAGPLGPASLPAIAHHAPEIKP